MAKILLFASLSALTSSLAQAIDCSSNGTNFINATGVAELRNPFNPPQGPLSDQSSDWELTLATTSSRNESGNATVEQKLWLDSSSNIDLTSPRSGVIGCGAIFHGLTHKTGKKGQDVSGSCDSIFGNKCIAALMSGAHNGSIQAGSDTVAKPGYYHPENYTATELCGYLAQNLAEDYDLGVPRECAKYFDEDNAWIQTFVFASAQTADMCSTDPASGSATNPLAAWGIASYSADDMTPYENLTTSVTPILLTMAANRTIIDTMPEGLYSQEHLLCLRPSSVEEGSVLVTEVPNIGNRRLGGTRWWDARTLVLASVVFTSALI